jgi:glucan phosphoethanolaminetransferase (alkaline phosphatase superfamily)
MNLDKRFISMLCFLAGLLLALIGYYATDVVAKYVLLALGLGAMAASYFVAQRPTS